ncbi:MAG TPA: HEAT repeat domain-containing protein [Candidatus Dormibacteraeota bacterium]
MDSQRIAAKVNQALVAALSGQPAVLDAKASELLANVDTVAPVISSVMQRRGITLAQQARVTKVISRAGLGGELLDALASPEAETRAAAAQLCGALRLAESVSWLADLLSDPEEEVSAAAARALGRTGGRRSVDALMGAVEVIPPYRLAVAIAHAASDIDLDGLLRAGGGTRTAVVVALACGLRADALRFPRLVAMARDRTEAPEVRAAACRALGMIGDRAAAGVLRNLSSDSNTSVSEAAIRALRRYHPGVQRPEA